MLTYIISNAIDQPEVSEDCITSNVWVRVHQEMLSMWCPTGTKKCMGCPKGHVVPGWPVEWLPLRII